MHVRSPPAVLLSPNPSLMQGSAPSNAIPERLSWVDKILGCPSRRSRQGPASTSIATDSSGTNVYSGHLSLQSVNMASSAAAHMFKIDGADSRDSTRYSFLSHWLTQTAPPETATCTWVGLGVLHSMLGPTYPPTSCASFLVQD